MKKSGQVSKTLIHNAYFKLLQRLPQEEGKDEIYYRSQSIELQEKSKKKIVRQRSLKEVMSEMYIDKMSHQ